MVLLLAMALLVIGPPAQAQSILRDAETEQLLKDVTRPIFEAARLRPESVNIYLLSDQEINAFVSGGQNIFINSGLLLQADNINQVIGVLAHETGHISGGHFIRSDNIIRESTSISIISLLAGIGAALAGAGDASAAILGAGQAAAQGHFLAYSRAQEAATDQAGAGFLDTAGISGKGMLEFFRKLQEQEFRYGYTIDEYARSHPLTSDRIEKLEQRLMASASYNKPVDPNYEERFQRIKAKLAGYLYEPARTLQTYPPTDTSTPARLARTYAYHKSAELEKATQEVDALLEQKPRDPYFLELKGQVLLESGKVNEAIAPLRAAVANAPNQPLIATTLGHALVATEEPTNEKEAITVLRKAVALDNDNPFAWFQLGVAYTRIGDEPRAYLASAERLSLTGAPPQQTLYNAKQATAGLTKGTPDWLRAQDIELIAEQQVKDKKRRR